MKKLHLTLGILAALMFSTEAWSSPGADTQRTYNKLKEKAKENYVSAIARAIINYDSILKDEVAIQTCIGVKADSDLTTLGNCKKELVRVMQASPGISNDKATKSEDTIEDLNLLEMAANMSINSFTNKSEPEKDNIEKVVQNPLYQKEIPDIRKALTPENKRKRLGDIKNMGSKKSIVSKFGKGSAK